MWPMSVWGFDRSAAGARGVVSTAYSACTRFRVLTALGIDTRQVAERIYGITVAGQSPFAFETGMRFERALLMHEAKYLIAQYVYVGRFTAAEAVLLDVGTAPSPQAATLDILTRRASGDLTTPTLLWQAALPSPIPGELIRPDLLVAGPHDRFYRPVEVKSYEERGGLTSDADIESAASQVAVSVVSLRALANYGYPRDAFLADIILRAPSGMTPRLRTVSVERDVSVIEEQMRAFPLTEAHVQDVLRSLGVDRLDSQKSLEAIPHRFGPGCREKCSLVDACKKRAIDAGELSRFGGPLAESLAPYATQGEIADAIARGESNPTLDAYALGVAALDELLA